MEFNMLKVGQIVEGTVIKVEENTIYLDVQYTTEGKNKQVRKMFEAIGHPVKKLTRVRYDFLTLNGVERGTYRQLKIHEVKQLYAHSQPKL